VNRRLVIPAIALVVLTLSAACSDNSTNNSSSADLYATQTAQSASSAATPTTAPTRPVETPSQTFAQACQKTGEKHWSAPPPRIIDTSKHYTATIKMAKGGDIVLELFSDVPITTNNFVFLACKGFYDGLTFHRVLSDYVAQGGDPRGDCRGDAGYFIPDEDSGAHTMDAGALSMAKSGPNRTGSQFFITYTAQPVLLQMGFVVFGRVTSGMDVMRQFALRDCGDPGTGDAIETITITEQP
jgi:peptidylprolyl isomerase